MFLLLSEDVLAILIELYIKAVEQCYLLDKGLRNLFTSLKKFKTLTSVASIRKIILLRYSTKHSANPPFALPLL